jgi:hypothetical protein
MASANAATEANMASSAHFYLNWAKERIDEMDAVLTSLEGKSAQVTASARAAAEKIVAVLRTRRDAFLSEMQQLAGASESAWVEAKTRLEGDWTIFQVDVKKYVEEFSQMQEQQKATFEGAAAAQLKAWRQAADRIQGEAATFAADRRAAIDTAVQQMRADATAAEANFQKVAMAGSQSWTALTTALTESRAAFDWANQVAWDAFKRADNAT